VPAPPGIVMVAPLEFPRNAEGGRANAAPSGGESAATGMIKAGVSVRVPAWSVRAIPLRLQAPRLSHLSQIRGIPALGGPALRPPPVSGLLP
jgi:hypothetical protein